MKKENRVSSGMIKEESPRIGDKKLRKSQGEKRPEQVCETFTDCPFRKVTLQCLMYLFIGRFQAKASGCLLLLVRYHDMIYIFIIRVWLPLNSYYKPRPSSRIHSRYVALEANHLIQMQGRIIEMKTPCSA